MLQNDPMNRFLSLKIICLSLLLASGCTCRREPSIPISSIDVNVEVIRFEKDLFSLSIDSVDAQIAWMQGRYGEFFNQFCEGVIGIGNPSSPLFSSHLLGFVGDPMVRQAYLDVMGTFPDTHQLDTELTKAFRIYRYYFPAKPIPKIYSFVSGFNTSIMLTDSALGVGLDRYLGSDSEYYPRLGIHTYLARNMHPGKISSDLVRAWALGEFPFNDSVNNVLSNIVYEGLLTYFTRTLLPHQPDSIILGFTSDQMRWCLRNEAQMWTHLIEHKLLFNTDRFSIMKLVEPAPFTQPFTIESPGRAGVWLGYRIVQRYMDRNPGVTLTMLMQETDYQRVLNLSRYNPR